MALPALCTPEAPFRGLQKRAKRCFKRGGKYKTGCVGRDIVDLGPQMRNSLNEFGSPDARSLHQQCATSDHDIHISAVANELRDGLHTSVTGGID